MGIVARPTSPRFARVAAGCGLGQRSQPTRKTPASGGRRAYGGPLLRLQGGELHHRLLARGSRRTRAPSGTPARPRAAWPGNPARRPTARASSRRPWRARQIKEGEGPRILSFPLTDSPIVPLLLKFNACGDRVRPARYDDCEQWDRQVAPNLQRCDGREPLARRDDPGRRVHQARPMGGDYDVTYTGVPR